MHFVASVHPYHQTPLFVSYLPQIPEERVVCRPGCFWAHPSSPACSMEQRGSPRFLGRPSRAFALLMRPRPRPLAMPSRQGDVAPASQTTKAATISQFRGCFTRLQHLLSTLPASAFPTLARLASGGWQTLTGWESNPLVSYGEFQVRFHLPSILTPQA